MALPIASRIGIHINPGGLTIANSTTGKGGANSRIGIDPYGLTPISYAPMRPRFQKPATFGRDAGEKQS